MAESNITENQTISFQGMNLVPQLIVLHTIFGLVSEPGNIFVMWLTINDAELRSKATNMFIFNLALSDFMYALSLIAQSPVLLLRNPTTFCKVDGFLQYFTCSVTFYVPPLIALNRYFALCRMDNSTFSKRNCLFMNVYCWVHSVGGILPYAFFDALGEDIYRVCGVVAHGANTTLNIYFNAYTILSINASYITVLVCYKKVRKWLKEKQSVLKSRPNAQFRQTVRDSNAMLKMMAFISIAPLIFQGPGVIVKTAANIYPPLKSIYPPWLAATAYSTFPLTSFVNPWITLLIVKPYHRAAMKTWLARFLPQRTVRVGPQMMTNTVMSHQGHQTEDVVVQAKN